MNPEFEDLMNPEKYYYFIIITQISIWSIYFINLFLFDNEYNFNDKDNFNYYLPCRIFEPCDSCLDIRNQVWRLISYSVSHNDFIHIFCNSVGLLCYSYINIYYKSGPLVFIYLNSIFIGSLSFIFFNPYGILIGNSAGVYGLIGASYGHQLLNSSIFNYKINITFSFFNLIPIFTLINYYFLEPEKKTAHICHLYGFITGLSTSLFILPRFQEKKYHSTLEFLGFSGYIILIFYFGYGLVTLPHIHDPKFDDECCF